MRITFSAFILFPLLLVALQSLAPTHLQAQNLSHEVERTPASTQSELSNFLKIHRAKEDIIKPPHGLLKYEYLVPAGPYDQLFDWDMYFMGVALSYDKVGLPLASSVKDFLQFSTSDFATNEGYVPREIATDAFWAMPEQCKPFMAQAAVRASQTLENNYSWLNENSETSKKKGVITWYKRLKSMMTFWETHRQNYDGLFLWYNGVESGVDNNPAVANSPAATTEGVDLQVYLIREYRALALIAGKLGLKSDSRNFTIKAKKLRQDLLEKMWSTEDQIFYNIDSRTGRRIKIKTWVSFTPLWDQIATNEQAHAMIARHLLNPKEFWAAHGIRTLSADEKLYSPKDGYWRGPVWVVSNYLIMHGLMSYGYKAQAIDLAQKTVDVLVSDYKKTGGMNECYNPENGRPTAGGNFLSWNLLAEHMLEEAQNDCDPTALK